MRTATTVGVFTICILWLGAAGANVQTCEPDGEVQFLCGPVSPEDLAPVPQCPESSSPAWWMKDTSIWLTRVTTP